MPAVHQLQTCLLWGSSKPHKLRHKAGAVHAGYSGNTGKFCQNCGAPKPENNGSWTCSCGAVNEGKFCQNCGGPRPSIAPAKCKNCGWQPADGAAPPKFLPRMRKCILNVRQNNAAISLLGVIAVLCPNKYTVAFFRANIRHRSFQVPLPS